MTTEGAPSIEDVPVENSSVPAISNPSKEVASHEGSSNSGVGSPGNSSRSNNLNNDESITVSTQGSTKDGTATVDEKSQDPEQPQEEREADDDAVPILTVSTIDEAPSTEESEISVATSKGNSEHGDDDEAADPAPSMEHVEGEVQRDNNKQEEQEEMVTETNADNQPQDAASAVEKEDTTMKEEAPQIVDAVLNEETTSAVDAPSDEVAEEQEAGLKEMPEILGTAAEAEPEAVPTQTVGESKEPEGAPSDEAPVVDSDKIATVTDNEGATSETSSSGEEDDDDDDDDDDDESKSEHVEEAGAVPTTKDDNLGNTQESATAQEPAMVTVISDDDSVEVTGSFDDENQNEDPKTSHDEEVNNTAATKSFEEEETRAVVEPPVSPSKQNADLPPAKKMDVKEREESLKATLKKTTTQSAQVNKMDVKQREASLKATLKKTTSQPAVVNKIDVKEREQSLKDSLTKTSSFDSPTGASTTATTTTAQKLDVPQREASLKASVAQQQAQRKSKIEINRRTSEGSFGSRYKKGLVPDLSLDSSDSQAYGFQSVRNQIAAYNENCQLKPVQPSKEARELSEMKARSRRASTGDIVKRKEPRPSSKNVTTSLVQASPPRNTSNKNLLMTYNKDLYYTNELNKLIDVDPSDPVRSKKIAFEDISKIVEECPSVCRAKYDLTFNSEKRKLYPLFSLVANGAPLELIRMVFFENSFRFIDVCDDKGQNILHYACTFKPLPKETLDFLIQRCPQSLTTWDEKNRSPLHVACFNMSSADETVLYILEQSPSHVAATPDNDGKLPLDLAVMNKKCSSKLKQSLIDRAKGVEPLQKEKEKPAPELVIGKYSASAPAGPEKAVPPPSSGVPPPMGTKAPKPPEPEVPKPSFWDLICCRPVSW